MATTQRQPERTAQGHPTESASHLTARTTRRTATLERNSQRLIKSAGRAGLDVSYLGIAPLFDEPRAYAGPQTDWVIRPAADLEDAIVPVAERNRLLRLVHAGIDFPLVYVAHEIPKGRLAIPGGTVRPVRQVALDHITAAEAVGPVPAPAGASALAVRLGLSSQHVLTVLRTALPIAGAIAAAPFVIAGAAISTIAEGLDPIVFGVIPAGPPTPGQPAAWYILARWEWPGMPDTAL